MIELRELFGSCKRLLEELRYLIELRVVRSLLGECEVFDRVGVVRRFVRRNVRYLIELRAVRSLLEENSEVLIELRVVRSLLVEWRGIR